LKNDKIQANGSNLIKDEASVQQRLNRMIADKQQLLPRESPVEITVAIPLDNQVSFEVPCYEEAHKRPQEPQLATLASSISATSGHQMPRVSVLDTHAIMEMSSSEQESQDNRSRATSFNAEPLSIRLREHMPFMQSPETHYLPRATNDDFHTSKRQLIAVDARARLFSGADADVIAEEFPPEVSESG
jgi:hypothetical protein